VAFRPTSRWSRIVGFKPSFARVSTRDIVPSAYSLGCAGPIARSVEDVAFMLKALAGYDPQRRHRAGSARARILARDPRFRSEFQDWRVARISSTRSIPRWPRQWRRPSI
jgi:Asp-tRNA(Asn)/Glu-tRNA(Gln) amidotransferase A subunit family amidase